MINGNPFHEGELATQRRAGSAQTAQRNGVIINGAIPLGALQFIRKQRMVVVGTQDLRGRLWASLLFGKPGFLDPVEDGRSLRMRLEDIGGSRSDPFWRNIEDTDRIGILVIDLASRRRLRINGHAISMTAGEMVIEVDEAFPNCPKYIQRRQISPGSEPQPAAVGARLEGSELAPALIAAITRADTFFVATAHDRGLDVSHRGGNQGFVNVTSPASLRIPDYSGNGMFSTLGNLALNPNAGLVFPDFENRSMLQLTGTARVQWDQNDQAGETGGTGRFWQFEIASWIQTPITDAIAFEFVDYSPFNPEAVNSCQRDD